jgi:hypothetical protein
MKQFFGQFGAGKPESFIQSGEASRRGHSVVMEIGGGFVRYTAALCIDGAFPMNKLNRALPIIILTSALAMGCAEAAHTTGEVTNDTGSAVGSVLDGVGAVVMWPFHVIGDLFS